MRSHHGRRTDTKIVTDEGQTIQNENAKPWGTRKSHEPVSQSEDGWASKGEYRNKSYVSKEIGPEERPENQQQETHALHKRHSSSGCEGHKNGGEACDDECILVTISIMSCVNKFDFVFMSSSICVCGSVCRGGYTKVECVFRCQQLFWFWHGLKFNFNTGFSHGEGKFE